jgi:type I restriction enzyme S subunit
MNTSAKQIEVEKTAETGDELPEGWATATLGDLAKVEWGNTSITKKSYTDKGFPAFSASGKDGLLPSAEWHGPAVVLSAIGARCGKCFYAEGDWTAIKNTIVIQSYEKNISNRYLFFYLNDDHRWSISGSGQPFITMGTAELVSVPVAPRNEQDRIVEHIEKLISKTNVSKTHLANCSAILRAFRQAVLAAAYLGKLTEGWRSHNIKSAGVVNPKKTNLQGELPETWRVVEVQELLSEPLINGRSVPDAKNGFPVLRLTALKDGTIDLRERKIGDWSSEDAKRFLVKQNDFLIARGSGSLTRVGRGGVVEVEPDLVAFPDTLIRIRLAEHVNQKYFAIIWNSQFLRDQIETTARTTAGIFKINQKDVEKFAFPVPLLQEQREIVRRVDALFQLADAIEKRVEAATLRAERLTQAILAKAFRGELVPTEAELARREGRGYESASERIRKEREKAGEKGLKRGKRTQE